MTGLDIGSKTIKIVEVQKSGGAFALSASGIVGISGQSVDKLTDDKDFAGISQIIKKLHSEAGVSDRNVAISIPEQLVFTRTIKFPLLTDQEVESAVKWESEQYIPIPLNEAMVQHMILERRETASPPEVVVLLVAAPRVVVDKYIKVVQGAGLNVVSVETELLALSRSLGPLDKSVLLVDIGATSTDIAVCKKGLLSFSRSIPIAGEAFTRAVSQTLGVAPTQAEEYKKTYGLGAKELEGKIKGALDPVLRMVTDEIKKAIHYYQTDEKGEMPTAVIITGGTSGMREIISVLSGLLGLEVVLGNPFSKLAIDPETLKRLVPYAPLYSVAVGLALRDD
jgi:type IV pilus assembly protein PilM